jgi:hypothetical protein
MSSTNQVCPFDSSTCDCICAVISSPVRRSGFMNTSRQSPTISGFGLADAVHEDLDEWEFRSLRHLRCVRFDRRPHCDLSVSFPQARNCSAAAATQLWK